MKLRDIIFASAVSLALLLTAFFALLRSDSEGPTSGVDAYAHQHDEGGELRELWPAPAFSWPDQHGDTVTTESLKGQVWVVNFIFTSCRTVCPLLTSKMVQLQRLLKGVDVRFVSISVDPENDTPEALAAYAKKWAPEETRWSLLSTDEATLSQVAAGFKVVAQKSDAGGVDPIIHSAVFLLVDQRGIVRGAFSSEERDDFKALVEGAKTLAGKPADAAPALATDGASLYHQLSCDGCHANAELAPPLGGRAGKRQELTTGSVVTVDTAYVRESLLYPQAKMVRGYTLQMPSYDGLLDAPRLEALAAYVLALPADDAAPDDAEAHVEEDPVCHMKVRVTASTPSAEADGGVYHFCSEYCRKRFAASPGAWLKPAE